MRVRGMFRMLGVFALLAIAGCGADSSAEREEKLGTSRQSVVTAFAAGSLVIPMDTTFQNDGMLRAYGLVYRLLSSNIPVHWAILPGKAQNGVDFTASGTDFQTNAAITNAGYRGGPFIIAAADSAAAAPIIIAWQAANPTVRVHTMNAFSADVRRTLVAAPRLAVFVDGFEAIAFNYLRGAGIPDSTGQQWPAAQDATGVYAGFPDVLSETEVRGAATGGAFDGALLRSDGTPAYCQLTAMHYAVPGNAALYGEVVREVRGWLDTGPTTHAIMQCAAATTFENHANGRFISTNGLVDDGATPNPEVNLTPDATYAQYDGAFTVDNGLLDSMGLATASAFRTGVVQHIRLQGAAANTRIVLLSGSLDGNPAKGKLSYLGGHDYTTTLPITTNATTNGTRLFLDSLFETPCGQSTAQPNLTFTKSAPATAGANITYALSYSNTGTGIADSVVITDAIPPGTTFVSATNGGTFAGGTVTFNIGNVGANANGLVSFVVAPTTDGPFINQARLAYRVGVTPKQILSNATTTSSAADLSIAVTDAPDPVLESSPLTWTIVASNAGPSASQTVSVAHTLPPGATFVSATGTGWTCGAVASVVTCTRPTLAAGAAPPIVITATTPANGPSPLSASTTISASTSDPVPGNNTVVTTTAFSSTNDAPVNTAPATLTTVEDTPVTFTLATSDADAGGNLLEVTLSATNGTLTLSGTAGLTFTAGDGNADATMTFRGSLASINAAVAGMSFRPTANYFGAATITFTTNDLGNSGTGGAKTDTDTIAVTVTGVNDAPVAGADSATTPAGVPIKISVLANDSDAENQTLGIQGVSTPGKGTAVVNPDGTITYTPNAGTSGTDTFTYTVSDGSGGTTTGTVTVIIDKDTDGDGLPDSVEIAIGTNPNDADSDDDGVPDGKEPDFDKDTDGDGLINALDPDSDNDGLFDGTELGLACNGPGTDIARGSCVPDGDQGKTKTDPLKKDTDGGGMSDGSEDANLNGVIDPGETDPTVGHGADDATVIDTDKDGLSDKLEATLGSNPNDADTDDDGVPDGLEANPSADTDGDKLLNVLDVDSDNDALYDGTEMGFDCIGKDTNASLGHCIADGDKGATKTSPLLRDTDRGGKSDGSEDVNRNGVLDLGETDPTAGQGADDANVADSDGDGLGDKLEVAIGSNPNDADSDDDGLPDGEEPNPADDHDGDGKKNIVDPDSDNDGLFDGTEAGKGCVGPGTDASKKVCIADADQGKTTTKVLDADTDNGTVSDGDEDTNKNGVVDPGETNPNDPKDDKPVCKEDKDCGDTASGRVCDQAQCKLGCRGEGGNGCPSGLVCTSTSNQVGQCEQPKTPADPDEGKSLEGGGCACNLVAPQGTSLGRLIAGIALGLLALRRWQRR